MGEGAEERKDGAREADGGRRRRPSGKGEGEMDREMGEGRAVDLQPCHVPLMLGLFLGAPDRDLRAFTLHISSARLTQTLWLFSEAVVNCSWERPSPA